MTERNVYSRYEKAVPKIAPLSPQPILSESERVGLALAHLAYQTGAVRVANPNLGGFSHIVVTRQGLFAVNENRYSLLAHGLFFGITLRGSSIYVFEACDLPRVWTRRGRIVRLIRDGDRVVRSEVIVSGLDNGCHQIDFIDDRLCILDTYNQCILRFLPDGTGMERLHPLPPGAKRDGARGYLHANSLLQVEDKNLLLLHNGDEPSGQQSAIAVCDREWRLVDRWLLSGEGCHNIAALEDGSLLSCGSLAGELIGLDGLRIKISNMMTRGLSVGADSIAIGASTFSSRRDRRLAPGAVTFLGRGYGVRAVLDIPGAPTDIRRLDGCDYSLSSYVRNKVYDREKRENTKSSR